MTISYNWLHEYLPEVIDPERLSRILTSLGLEVEQMERTENIRGGLAGLVVGEVLECGRHPDADRLTLTRVDIGQGEPLSIVCGAPNVAVGQKVIVAPVGTTIYPVNGEPLTMRKAKIRGVESHGMICAEDEIGLGDNHDGILVLDNGARVGAPATEYFPVETDWVYTIGLTPNRMDAMSHLGVARDVCAWLTHHNKKPVQVKSPLQSLSFSIDDASGPDVQVTLEDANACRRYAGVCISGVQVGESPDWLKNRLLSIGLRPISNIVDITNFILHETGQPLHAFDADAIPGRHIRVKTLPEGTTFVTLDEKERQLSAEDLMICGGDDTPLCIGGVFGGLHSGVTEKTVNIFLESAWFAPVSIRKSSFRHGLRTDAATRFEKGVDISQTVQVLKRAALLIREIAGGQITGQVHDAYPVPEPRAQVALKYHYLKKLSGKNYHPDAVKRILESLGFSLVKEGADDLWFDVPYHKPDIRLPADLVEEIMRIDGYDNVDIPEMITIAPAPDPEGPSEQRRERIASYLTGLGFREILTNSIVNSAYYSESELGGAVRMMNNLSAELDIMRPSMQESMLEVVAHNLNRRNRDLLLYEFGKTYHARAAGEYSERRRLAIVVSGQAEPASWRGKGRQADLYYLKGVVANLLSVLNLPAARTEAGSAGHLKGVAINVKGRNVGVIGEMQRGRLQRFDIRQPVYMADLDWDTLLELAVASKVEYTEIPRFPAVDRDLAVVVDRAVTYDQLAAATGKARVKRLQQVQLFDVFESEKIGAGKKSMALSFRFQDPERTLTDSEVDAMMQQIVAQFEKDLQASIRK